MLLASALPLVCLITRPTILFNTFSRPCFTAAASSGSAAIASRQRERRTVSEDAGFGEGGVGVESVGDVDVVDAYVACGEGDGYSKEVEAEKAVSCSIAAICFVGICDGFASI